MVSLSVSPSSTKIPNALKTNPNKDNAAFNGRLIQLPDNIAQAVLPLGFPSSSLEPLITDLATGHPEELESIPSITPEIIGAAVRALRLTFVDSFRAVWITAACFTVLGVIGKFRNLVIVAMMTTTSLSID